MQTREWILTVAVIVVPLVIAVVVTLWSLDQVRYRPKKRRPATGVARETPGAGAYVGSGNHGADEDREPAAPGFGGTGGGDGAEDGLGNTRRGAKGGVRG